MPKNEDRRVAARDRKALIKSLTEGKKKKALAVLLAAAAAIAGVDRAGLEIPGIGTLNPRGEVDPSEVQSIIEHVEEGETVFEDGD